jgi:chromosome segregation ATPase
MHAQSMAEMIDSVLKARVRAVLDGRPATEAELRKLFEEGRACALILDRQIEKGEQKLGELTSDPESSIAELAAAFRRVNELRPSLAELDKLLAELDARAREFRASWLLMP